MEQCIGSSEPIVEKMGNGEDDAAGELHRGTLLTNDQIRVHNRDRRGGDGICRFDDLAFADALGIIILEVRTSQDCPGD
jgi:hypothetical protein